ncbi:hypothetical protein G5I_12651 [Acromyrmex echinatior]|uniref:Uncharacterized protein n=1 Tax=Acromyrmex echinatior TaxID=103372 RepID=F4X2W9_ACREC|nr:hypothetical protein G5I_12651 [Acromyrmex echinatior]
MSRGRATASSIVPPRANRGEGSRQHHGRRRLDALVGQPSRDHPAPATVARQRRRERGTARDALLDRAKDVASIADLEAFAASVAAFFGEDASATGAAARARDRSVQEYFERLYSGGEDLAGAGVEAERPDPSSPREVARGARGGPSAPAYEQLCAGSRRCILP